MRAVEDSRPYVSTGHLPDPLEVRSLVDEAYGRYRSNDDGLVSATYPALARVKPDLFGICVVGASGGEYEAGDASHGFTIMSVSKPFVFALVANQIGAEVVRQRVGVNATGQPFNALSPVEESRDGRTNPMVNAGALATTSQTPGQDIEAKWRFLREGLSNFAGRPLALNEEVYVSASETNFRNRSIAMFLRSVDRLYSDAAETVELYTRQCSLEITARDLAVMGATLACGGINPITKQVVVSQSICSSTLAVMLTAGMYETSGDWLFDIGLPGKSGIGGGIVMVSPGKGGLGTFAPRLDAAGNSVKGQLVARHLSQRLGLNLLTSSSQVE